MSEEERFGEMYLEREREIGRLARHRAVRGFGEEGQNRSQSVEELRRVRRNSGSIGRARGGTIGMVRGVRRSSGSIGGAMGGSIGVARDGPLRMVRGMWSSLRGSGIGRGRGTLRDGFEEVGLDSLRLRGRVEIAPGVSLRDDEVDAARHEIHSQWV